LHASREELITIRNFRHDTETTHADHTAEIAEHTEILHEDLKIAAFDLLEAMFVSSVSLFFPLNMLFKYLVIVKTKRQASLMDSRNIIDGIICCLTAIWIWYYLEFRKFDPHNHYLELDSGGDENFMVNIMWYIHCSSSIKEADTYCKDSRTFRFDFLLSAIAFFTWFKLFLCFRVSETFGPMYKMMGNMIYKLVIFLVIWAVILGMFTCVAILCFGEIEFFYNLFDVLIMFFESGLGAWDYSLYHGYNDDQEPLDTLYYIGVLFQCLFLLINLVLMLNFVIAILTNTFAELDTVKTGLFYQQLINIFPVYDWDDKYGYILCAQSPLNVFLPLMVPWTVLYSQDDEALMKLNQRFALVFYLPFAVGLTLFFAVVNILLVPVAYGTQLIRLFFSIFLVGDLKDVIKRILTTVKFGIFGPILLGISIIVDPIVFFQHLFNTPKFDSMNNDFEVKRFTAKGITLFEETCNEVHNELKEKA